LQFGDRNSSFFHRFASARRKRNFIKKLGGRDGKPETADHWILYTFVHLGGTEYGSRCPTKNPTKGG
jgi:hypothetical protein